MRTRSHAPPTQTATCLGRAVHRLGRAEHQPRVPHDDVVPAACEVHRRNALPARHQPQAKGTLTRQRVSRTSGGDEQPLQHDATTTAGRRRRYQHKSGSVRDGRCAQIQEEASGGGAGVQAAQVHGFEHGHGILEGSNLPWSARRPTVKGDCANAVPIQPAKTKQRACVLGGPLMQRRRPADGKLTHAGVVWHPTCDVRTTSSGTPAAVADCAVSDSSVSRRCAVS